MNYGTLKLDTIVYTSGGFDSTVTVSGLANGASGVFPSGTAAATAITVGSSGNGLYSPGTNQVAISTSGVGRLFIDGTGQVETASLGTAAAPVYSFVNDPNTGIYSPGADQLAISTNSTQRLLIDASGNVNIDSNTLYVDATNNRVGIGTTSPAARLHVSSSGTGTSAGSNIVISARSEASGRDAAIQFADGTTSAYVGMLSGAIYFADAGSTERARIDSSGRLLVGTSSESGNALFTLRGNTGSATGAGVLDIGLGTTRPGAAGTPLGYLRFTSTSNTGSNYHYASIAAETDGTSSSDTDIPGRLVFSTTPDSGSSPVERVRIDNAGTTKFTAAAASTNLVQIVNDNATPTGIAIEANFGSATGTNTNTAYLYSGRSGGAQRFYVYGNGGIANYSANNSNLSDRNAKKDISPAAGTWDCIKEWEIVNYRYKDQADDADLNLGVIAQQVAESCPEVITVFEQATEDRPEKLGIKEQQMYWMAIKALQEAQVRIEQLEAKVAALESA